MIIFGTKVKPQEIGRGEFDCPRCRAHRSYRRLRNRRYFTLYFIPLIPLGSAGEYVQCETCNTAFELAALDYRLPDPGEQRIQAIRADVRGGLPLPMACRKLINAGLGAPEARAAVRAAAGVSYRACPACRLTYHDSIERCTSCGAGLVPTFDDGLDAVT